MTQTETVCSEIRTGREIERLQTRPDRDPFDAVEWETREASISDERGRAVFEQRGVEVPAFWSQMATNVVVSKYFRGEAGSPGRETSVRQLISRVADSIAEWGAKDGYFASASDAAAFRDELVHTLLHQRASFNSPVWFNVGINEKPQCSACFIVSVDDTIDSLTDLQATEAKLFKHGSGVGTNLSSIRSSREKLGGGGVPSGPVSFMRAFDAWAGIIKSGGKTRRAAKMQILDVTHPDIREFVKAKSDEERKAWALIEQGYDGGFAVPGGAYDSVGFQNANLSVRVGDDFMRAVEAGGTYHTLRVTDGKPCEEIPAREIMRAIAEGTHVCGDPGMQFDTTINEWHTCPASGRINASNPCSEYMHLDDSACNLSSINLLRFLGEDGAFDYPGFLHTVDILITAQDILVDRSSYPTKKIEATARAFRQLGLGFANLGALLMSMGLPYDSEGARSTAALIASLMTGQAYLTSARLAAEKGAFAGYRKNRAAMTRVIERHATETRRLDPVSTGAEAKSLAVSIWDAALREGAEHGYRNSQVSVLAPTGTISFMMDCDTTGVEPDIALVKYKKLVGGGMLKLVNASVGRALRKLGYAEPDIAAILAHVDEHDCIEGAPGLRAEHLPVFDCAFRPAKGERCIGYRGHLLMMAAIQPFISGAISKTVNLPPEVTVQEIEEIYLEAWRLGIKAVALYRDGSKRTQPLSTAKHGAKKESPPMPARRRLPDERSAITHKFNVGGLEGYLTVGLFPDGSPGEIFIVVAKEGSTLSGVMDAFATSVSISLQYGVPLTALVKKFSYMRFDPAGFTGNPEIPMAHSLIDYVFRWLAAKFLRTEELGAMGLAKLVNAPADDAPKSFEKPRVAAETGRANGAAENGSVTLTSESSSMTLVFENMTDAPPCLSCGSSLMVRQAGCYVCLNCGSQGGCG